MRVVQRGEFAFARINGMDRALFLAYAYVTAVFLLRTSVGFGTSTDIPQVTIMAKVGLLVDVTLCYIIFRGLITTVEDFKWLLRGLVMVLAPYVVLVFIERHTGHNPFAAVGGIHKVWIDGDRVRCFGSFMHPSLLGTFGASFLLLYVGFAIVGGNRISAIAGFGLCLAIVFLANSGGPLTFLAVGWWRGCSGQCETRC